MCCRWRFLGLVVAIASVAALLLLMSLPTPAGAYVAPITGCHHNGSWYADKSLVPSTEKCLNCQCQVRTLVCRLKVCPEMPVPPPRGCVVVQTKHVCCPYLSCARLEAFYKIPIRRRIIQYLDHFERESIDRVVNENVLQRRSDDSGDTDLHVCVKNGTVYKSGSAMSSSNLCSYCYCIGGAEKCVKPKCMLPVEGCKPIFVDSTCCPVRYDCSNKAAGKSSQEVHYRKVANKHFQRMSQRLQRNRGCSAGAHFYAEGQKMKSDAERPCDICFCIRGTRRCAPKKCAPALKNCIPVVPKGQCCPSSYDCGSQRDYRRAQSSRQFNLFSLFFGKDPGEEVAEQAALDSMGVPTEIGVQYPHDRRPPQEKTPPTTAKVTKKPKPTATTPALSATSEKSIFDSLRAGLEFIDGQNDQLLEENVDLVGAASEPLTAALQRQPPAASVVRRPPPTASPLAAAPSTEVSFLDLLLGATPEGYDEGTEGAGGGMEVEGETSSSPETKTTLTKQEPSWMELLLGPDGAEEDKRQPNAPAEADDSTISDKLDEATMASDESAQHDSGGEYEAGDGGATNIDRIDQDFNGGEEGGDDSAAFSGEISVDDSLLEKENELLKAKVFNQLKMSTTTTTTTTTTTARPFIAQEAPMKPMFKPIAQQKKAPLSTTQRPNVTTPRPPALEVSNDQLEGEPPSLLSALLDGISGLLAEPNVTSTATESLHKDPAALAALPQPSTALPPPRPTSQPTSKTPPHFKPLPVVLHTRINSKIANLTTNPPLVTAQTQQRQPTARPGSAPAKLANAEQRATTTRKPPPSTSHKHTVTSNTRPPTEGAPSKGTTKPKTITTTQRPARPTTARTTATPITTTTEAATTARPTSTSTTPSTTTTPATTTTTTTTKRTTARPPPKRATKRPHATRPPAAPARHTAATRTKTSARPATPPPQPPPEPPLLIESNPSILEAEPQLSNGAPTLPPSLPNLKIIPFLPADAVEADRQRQEQQQQQLAAPSSGSSSSQSPSSSSSHSSLYTSYYHTSAGQSLGGGVVPLEQQHHLVHGQISRGDYDLYDDGTLYPAITERFPAAGTAIDDAGDDTDAANRAAYIYKFQVEGPAPQANQPPQPAAAVAMSAATVAITGDVAEVPLGVPVQTGGGFLPPTKTEGGFVPKETFIIGADGEVLEAPPPNVLGGVGGGLSGGGIGVGVGDSVAVEVGIGNYQVTPHNMEFSSDEPAGMTTTAAHFIEFTTPDPFRDVIRTEPPPDLTSLIEDKEKTLTLAAAAVAAQQQQQQSEQQSSLEQEAPSSAFKQDVAAKVSSPPQTPSNGSLEDASANIASLLDLLFKDEAIVEREVALRLEAPHAHPPTSDADDLLTPTSVVPPFKSLPATLVERISSPALAEWAAPTTPLLAKTTTVRPPTPSPTTTTTPVTTTTTTTRPASAATPAPAAVGAQKLAAAGKRKAKPTKVPNNSGRHPPAAGGTMHNNNTQAATATKATKPKNPERPHQRRPTSTTQMPPNTATATTTTTTTPPHRSSTAMPPPLTTEAPPNHPHAPHLMSPFDKLPFLDTSFEVKPYAVYPPLHAPSAPQRSDDDVLEVLRYKNTLNQYEAREPIYATSSSSTTSTTTTTTTTTTSRPVHYYHHSAATAMGGDTPPPPHAHAHVPPSPANGPTNSLADLASVLKLAGCNIYGRMYRVGRIILELSSACQECKCTEVGVKCGPLNC